MPNSGMKEIEQGIKFIIPNSDNDLDIEDFEDKVESLEVEIHYEEDEIGGTYPEPLNITIVCNRQICTRFLAPLQTIWPNAWELTENGIKGNSIEGFTNKPKELLEFLYQLAIICTGNIQSDSFR